MIKRALCLGISLLTTAAFIPTTWASVEYVKVCSLYGPGWSYIPGTAECINTSTGVIKSQTEEGGVISTNSALATRVARLEAQLRLAYNQLGMQLPEEQ